MAEEPFGLALRRLRERAGLTQEELAEQAGLSARAIRALERGQRRRPYPHTVRALTGVLGRNPEDRSALKSPAAARGRRPTPPSPLSSLVGREADVAAVRRLLDGGNRLVTLTGPGGVGKTRLALALGEPPAERFPDGVGFVPLAAIADPALLLPAIAACLDVQVQGAERLPDVLLDYLRGRQLLLVLDNCEHLPALAGEVTTLLSAAPGVSLLATSRGPLRVSGEQVYPVPVLALDAAARLFRARAAQAGRPLLAADEGAVAAICERLDGLPLAIELAAARTRVLSPAALLDRLDRPLAVLAGGPRDLPDRQHTLSRTIAWSHDLLPPEERAMFQRLAVFAGSWRLDDAAVVAGLDELAAIELHAGLVDGSLLVRRREGPEPRFGMLETVRAFAVEQLETGGAADAIRDRHAAHYQELALAAGRETWSPAQAEWLDRLDDDLDNVRLALRRRLTQGDAEGVVEASAGNWLFWWIRGQVEEGLRLLEETAGADRPLGPTARARLMLAQGFLCGRRGRLAESSRRLEEASQLARQEGDEETLAWARVHQGFGAVYRNQPDLAATLLDEATTLGRRLALPDVVARTVVGRAFIALSQGHWNDAAAIMTAGTAEVGEGASPWSTATIRGYRGRILLALGELPEAETILRQTAAEMGRLRDRDCLGKTLLWLAALATERGAATRAAHLLGAADPLLERGVFVLRPYDHPLDQRCRTAALEHLGPDAFTTHYRHGRSLPYADLVALATGDTAAD